MRPARTRLRRPEIRLPRARLPRIRPPSVSLVPIRLAPIGPALMPTTSVFPRRLSRVRLRTTRASALGRRTGPATTRRLYRGTAAASVRTA